MIQAKDKIQRTKDKHAKEMEELAASFKAQVEAKVAKKSKQAADKAAEEALMSLYTQVAQMVKGQEAITDKQCLKVIKRASKNVLGGGGGAAE